MLEQCNMFLSIYFQLKKETHVHQTHAWIRACVLQTMVWISRRAIADQDFKEICVKYAMLAVQIQ